MVSELFGFVECLGASFALRVSTACSAEQVSTYLIWPRCGVSLLVPAQMRRSPEPLFTTFNAAGERSVVSRLMASEMSRQMGRAQKGMAAMIATVRSLLVRFAPLERE